MKRQMSLANTSFSYLAKSPEFLNLVLNNICSCVLMLNDRMELQAYNDALKTIFSNRKDENLLYIRCGEAIGCASSIEEKKDCGTTSRCSECELRLAGMKSYIEGEDIYREHVIRPFFNSEGNKTDKHLQFSTRLFIFGREKYIIMIIEDITKNYVQEN